MNERGVDMSQSSNEYKYKYAKENLRRLGLVFPKEDFPPIKAAADARGMSMSGFVKEAIKEKMEREKVIC